MITKKTMLAIRKISPAFGVEMAYVPSPQPENDEVLIRVEASGICGTDLHIYDAVGDAYKFMWPYLPLTLGHEFCGRVIKTGPGASASLIAVAADDCISLPDSIGPDLGALIEPLTVAHGAVMLSGIGIGERILIMGAGAIAQGAAVFARLLGASQVAVTGFADTSRFSALRSMGFDDLVDRSQQGSFEMLRELAGDEGFDAVIELTGVPSTINEGLGVLKRCGVLVATGIHPHDAAVNVTGLVRREQQIRGNHGNTREGWHEVIRLLEANQSAFLPIITHRYKLEDGIEAFEASYAKVATKTLVYP